MRRPASRTAPALLAELAARQGDREALVDGPRRWSWNSLADAVGECARALAASGIGAGDRVGILAGNRAEWIIGHVAVMSLGAISVGLNTWATAHELAWQLAHAEVRALLVEPRFRERDFLALVREARACGDGLPALALCVAMDACDEADVLSWQDFLARGATVDVTLVDTASAAIDTRTRSVPSAPVSPTVMSTQMFKMRFAMPDRAGTHQRRASRDSMIATAAAPTAGPTACRVPASPPTPAPRR